MKEIQEIFEDEPGKEVKLEILGQEDSNGFED